MLAQLLSAGAALAAHRGALDIAGSPSCAAAAGAPGGPEADAQPTSILAGCCREDARHNLSSRRRRRGRRPRRGRGCISRLARDVGRRSTTTNLPRSPSARTSAASASSRCWHSATASAEKVADAPPPSLGASQLMSLPEARIIRSTSAPRVDAAAERAKASSKLSAAPMTYASAGGRRHRQPLDAATANAHVDRRRRRENLPCGEQPRKVVDEASAARLGLDDPSDAAAFDNERIEFGLDALAGVRLAQLAAREHGARRRPALARPLERRKRRPRVPASRRARPTRCAPASSARRAARAARARAS